MSKTAKIIIALAATLLATVILYFILRSFSWQEIFASIKTLQWTTIAVFIVFLLAISLLKAVRFFVVLRFAKVEVRFFPTALVFLTSQAFTPLPFGEIGRALLFKNKLHLEMDQVAAPVYLQALTELWTATFLALVSLFFIKLSFNFWLIGGLLLLLVFLSAMMLIPERLLALIKFLKSKNWKYQWLDKFAQLLESYKQYVVKSSGKVPWKLWLIIIFLGIAGHLAAGGLFWYIALILPGSLNIFQSIFAAVATVLLSSVFGIIPGGLGVTEGGLLGVLSSFGLSWNKAAVIILLYRAVTLPLLIIIALLFLLLIYLPNIFNHKK